jgi:glycosyltransferase involved in cell wall biosynthesis
MMARITSSQYDHILVRYIRSTGVLWGSQPASTQRVILDFDDIVSGSLIEDWGGINPGPGERLIKSLLRQWIRKYEKKCLQFGATLVCSEADRLKMDDGRHRAPFVVPNVYRVDDGLASFVGDGFTNPNNLLFVGTLAYQPNRSGLQWFLDTIFPQFRAVYPGATLTVVGREPTTQLRAACDGAEGVSLQADVPDLRPFYRNARAVVVPLLAGGGTRIKILEAAAAGRPVLSTQTGAEGLALRDGKEILIFQDADDFVESYGRLAARTTYDSLVDGARLLVRTRYSTQAFEKALTLALQSMHRCRTQSPSE